MDSDQSIPGYPVAHSRELDRRAIEDLEMPSLLLMEHASLGTAVFIESLLEETDRSSAPTVWILCGPGNNGGDGFATARHLHNAGLAVTLWDFVTDPPTTGDAAVNRRLADAFGIDRHIMRGSLPASPSPEIVVDALFGSGLSRPLSGLYGEAVQRINECSATTVALDVPSGLDADRGAPLESVDSGAASAVVKADYTVTYGLNKAGFRAGRSFTGLVQCVPIGVPRGFLAERTPAFPPFPHSVDNGRCSI